MGLSTGISWTDATWNPWQGCTKVSPACEHCYMFRDLKRYGRDGSIVVRSKPPTFNLPMKRRQKTGDFAIADGWKVFTCSWSDWFHKRADAWRPEAWEIIRRRPGVIFQIVTKRPERIAECLPADWGDGYPNVWLIVTVENQEWADVRVPELLNVPAAMRGLSVEPLLGPLDLTKIGVGESTGIYTDALRGETCTPDGEVIYRGAWVDWVIVGGESGSGSRPMHPAWVRSLRDQCVDAGVAFHFKQWGEWLPIDQMPSTEHLYRSNRIAKDHEDQSNLDESYGRSCRVPELILRTDGSHKEMTDVDRFRCDRPGWPAVHAFRVGVEAAGRGLDGRSWDQFPTPTKGE